MRLRHILESKGRHVVTVEPDQTIHEAMQAMVRNDIGCLVVWSGGRINGIVSERDILKFAARRPGDVGRVAVSDIMTRSIIIGVPSDEVDCALHLMARNRIRHLPVVASHDLVGIVSLGDLVDAIRCDAELENRYLHDYIAGVIA